MQYSLECGRTNDIPLHVLCADIQVYDGGHAQQLLEVQVNLWSELVLLSSPDEFSDEWDPVHLNDVIQTP